MQKPFLLSLRVVPIIQLDNAVRPEYYSGTYSIAERTYTACVGDDGQKEFHQVLRDGSVSDGVLYYAHYHAIPGMIIILPQWEPEYAPQDDCN